ncbi:MAG: tyrosinase family protein [Deltaproteobacteria bacterium]|nr:tyrosinase family protein [Deltaproteobacteria bacterium]
MRIRHDYHRLDEEQRQRFVGALLALKDDGRYDAYVHIYQRATCWARRGPALLPWNRQLLLRFEQDLRSVEPDVSLPYWDFTSDRSSQSTLWNDDFMGGDGRPHDGMVLTGAFATEAGAWPLADDGFLVRRLGHDPVARDLPTTEDLEHALDAAEYDMAPWDASAPDGFRNRIEGWVRGPALHNRVHAWVGGTMARDRAPDDPLFWLVHAFIDKKWSDWQRRHPGAEYVPKGEGPAGHNLDDTLWPWNGGDRPEAVPPFDGAPEQVRPRDLLDHRVLGYAYDTDPDLGGGPTTTRAIGEEEPTMTTLAVGEEEPPMTTLAVGEEQPPGPTTTAEGEEEPTMTTLAVGEEEPPMTTLAVGEEQPPGPTTTAEGEEEPTMTTLAVGEEEPPMTTQAVGEEQPPGPTTAVEGEQEPPMTTLAVGEEASPVTTAAEGEEQPGPGGGGGRGPFGAF